MEVWVKTNGMERVYIIGLHPFKDFVAISSGEGSHWGTPIRFVSFLWFYENFVREK